MKKNPPMNQDTVCAVEDKYWGNPVYEALRTVLYELLPVSSTLKIHPADYFYQCFFLVDELRSLRRQQRSRAFISRQWTEISHSLTTDRSISASETDTDRIVAAIIMGAAQLIVRSRDKSLFDSASLLIGELETQGWNNSAMGKAFSKAFRPQEQPAASWLSKYVKGNVSVADDIAGMIDKSVQGKVINQNTFNISGGTVNNVGSTIGKQQNNRKYGE